APNQAAVGKEPGSDGETRETVAGGTNDETRGDQDKAIMKLVNSYVAAFNEGDAAAVATHWSKDGLFVNRTTGDRLVGREAIEASFREMFSDGPAGELQVEVESIRLVRPDVAVEDGTVRFVPQTGPVDTTSYTAIHVREENEWKLDSIRETASPSPPTNYDALSEWEWMVGYWTDELDEWIVETNCEWSANRNFLTRSFKVTKDDETQVQGVQVIGYDPVVDTIRCWVFHSGGGFGEGTIEFEDDRFVLVDHDSQGKELGYYPVRCSKDGTWTIHTIGEVSLPVEHPSEEKMKELEWMVGQWVDKDENATIETTCSWAPNKAFLRRSFKVAVQNRVDLAGLQLIGWDEDAEQFRSWVFDSAGGFANEQWSKEGDRWIVKSAGVLFGGEESSAVRIITPIDSDSVTMEVVDREVGGELLPDIDKVTIVRQKSGD
ncbi:MAG: SgcJ/EcaC family oxidoreductase, partial [Chloroflexi bacterium]|nr:SgcJ/EcaC family oxidoreductase [Chloroflexota bacterium]